MSKVAVVTGGNKGIGFAIVQLLCQKLGPEWNVYLTARNEELGNASVKLLNEKGLKPKFHQLDITSHDSILKFATHIMDKYEGLDILVNNAGIAYKQASTAPFGEQAEVTINTNFYGTLNLCEALFPLLRDHARVVNVSSGAARIFAYSKLSDANKKRVDRITTVDQLKEFLQEFIAAAKDGSFSSKGFPSSAYGMSKLGVTKMTFIHQAEFSKDSGDVITNSCCPGYCDTDMTSHKGPTPAIEGADTPVYLALLPPGTKEPVGKHVENRKVIKLEG